MTLITNASLNLLFTPVTTDEPKWQKTTYIDGLITHMYHQAHIAMGFSSTYNSTNVDRDDVSYIIKRRVEAICNHNYLEESDLIVDPSLSASDIAQLQALRTDIISTITIIDRFREYP